MNLDPMCHFEGYKQCSIDSQVPNKVARAIDCAGCVSVFLAYISSNSVVITVRCAAVF